MMLFQSFIFFEINTFSSHLKVLEFLAYENIHGLTRDREKFPCSLKLDIIIDLISSCEPVFFFIFLIASPLIQFDDC